MFNQRKHSCGRQAVEGSLAQSMACPECITGHAPAHLLRVLLRYRSMDDLQYYVSKWCQNMSCIYGCYWVTNETLTFHLAAKPWRVIRTVHNHTTNIKVSADFYPHTMELLIAKFVPLMRLAHSIRNLDISSEHDLPNILTELVNVKELQMYIDEVYVDTGLICQTFGLNGLTRLRSLYLKSPPQSHRGYEMVSSVSSSAAILFNRLKHADIQLPILQTLDIPFATFAYKNMYMQNEPWDFVDKWTEFSQHCPSLAHLVIEEFDERCASKLTVPPNLLSFQLSAHYTNFAHKQIHLNRLALEMSMIQWTELAMWCPNVHHLSLGGFNIARQGLIIHGRVTGLPLDELHLYYVTHTERNHFVRSMCMRALTRFKAILNDEILDSEFIDWITNPGFITGSHIEFHSSRLIDGGPSRREIKWKINNVKRVTLLFQEALYSTRCKRWY